ncbi:MAG: Rid family hydrolase [Polyangiaceae bacterium]
MRRSPGHEPTRRFQRPSACRHRPLLAGHRERRARLPERTQIPLDPQTGELVPGDIGSADAPRARLALRAVLGAAEANFDHLVKTTIYLVDLGDFATVNRVYAEVFHREPPARATVRSRSSAQGRTWRSTASLAFPELEIAMTESKSTFAAELLGATAERARGGQAAQRPRCRPGRLDQSSQRGSVAEVAEHGAGPARKAARRALNVLKSRGIAIPTRSHVASLVGEKGPEALEAWLLPPDTAGGTLLVVTARAPASRYRAAFVVLNDTFGVHRVDVGEVTHTPASGEHGSRAARRAVQAGEDPGGVGSLPNREARKRHAERGVPEPLGFAVPEPARGH